MTTTVQADVDNVLVFDNNTNTKEPIHLNTQSINIKDAIIFSMSYESIRWEINLVFKLLKYLLKQTKEFDEAFTEHYNRSKNS